jgi:hypothetical protein
MDAKQLHEDARSGKIGVDELLDVISHQSKTIDDQTKTIAAQGKTIAAQGKTIAAQGKRQRNFRDNLTPAWSSSKKSRRSRMAIRRSASKNRIR